MSDLNKVMSDELKLQTAIDKHLRDLIKIGDEVIARLGGGISTVDTNQIRNVIAIAATAPHPAIVTSFIRYQIGRSATAKAWKETGLGESLINAIEERVRDLAQNVSEGNDVDEIHIRMTRLLLGFMNHRYIYEKQKNEKQK